MPTRCVLALLFVVVAVASMYVAETGDEPHEDKLSWGPCTDPGTNFPGLPIACAKLEVPLDYLDKSSTEKLTLKLLKYPAVKEPHLGSILMNFGGPGALCRTILAREGNKYLHITGGQHDLITWDPRGSRDTLPFNCFKRRPANRARDILPHAIHKRISDSEALKLVWMHRGTVASVCGLHAAREGSLIGTAYSARDMLQIVDALEAGEGGLLRYWGLSAGSTLGATFVAMFPDRADRVLIDGVVNAHVITHSLGDAETYSSTDRLMTNIITACTELPDGCPLAKFRGESVISIEGRLIIALSNLWSNSLKIKPFVDKRLTWVDAHTLMYESLYSPPLYPDLIAGLAGLLNKNPAPMFKLFAGREKTQTMLPNRVIEGVRCGDQKVRLKELFSKEGIETIDAYRSSSLWVGHLAAYSTWMYCAQWKIDAKERYEGDFKVDTALKGPGMLIIGNSFDPATPWVSAQNMSASLKNSVLVKHNGHGHCSTAQRSDCTENIIRKYFTQGLLPEKDTVCEPNKDLWEYLVPAVKSKAKRDETSHVLMRQARRGGWI